MAERSGRRKPGSNPTRRGEHYVSPREVKLLLSGIILAFMLIGIALLLVIPPGTFLNPYFWIGVGVWSVFGVLSTWHDVHVQAPEAESVRRARSAAQGSHHHLKWVSIALLVLVLGLSRVAYGASPGSALEAFDFGIAGFLLVLGIGFACELSLREKLQYCSTCEGHRWYIHYRGQVVCSVCGNPWAGIDRAWVRPSEDARQRRTHHAMLEFIAAGPLITFLGMFGVQALPQFGLSDWVAVPLLLMFGGLVSTVALGLRFRRRMDEIRKS